MSKLHHSLEAASETSDDRRCSSRSNDSMSLGNGYGKTTKLSADLHQPSASLHIVAGRVELLIGIISKKLPIEIELNEQLYFSAFYSFNEQFAENFEGGFREFCSRALFRQFMFELQCTLNRYCQIEEQLSLRISTPPNIVFQKNSLFFGSIFR